MQHFNDGLQTAIDRAIAFWEALGGPDSEAAIAKLEGVRATIGEAGTQFLMTGKQFNESIANGAAQAFDRFAPVGGRGEERLHVAEGRVPEFRCGLPAADRRT